jgi:hypothetical protein
MTRSQRPAPEVGIIYLVGDKLFIDSTPINRAGSYGDHLIHERDHGVRGGQSARGVP